MSMALYILQILRTNLMVVFSWGFHAPRAIENGLSFLVSGYKFQGQVSVKYDEGADLFNVRFDGKPSIAPIEGIYIDQLVDVIDGAVERTDDYQERVKNQYSL